MPNWLRKLKHRVERFKYRGRESRFLAMAKRPENGISKVWLDETRLECDMCATCEVICPEVFEVPKKMTVKAGVDLTQLKEKILEAEASCPTAVIAVEFNSSGKRDNTYWWSDY